ncbi:TetR/AcrR family transcriptional regulator [Rhizobium tumorigenes]|uniref:TetR/AcrR family transcriptional regulator n=1 Tax=Rhizobium tumorigenes TaxID=2041385 RepID=UPI00241F6B24|nr:TetR/AcrR family transcriptional regulator [Rhizobium tumorigenes]WFR99740.1 TetR/AcrR family transcriptional regulator [Rhizobium tumorigenes]
MATFPDRRTRKRLVTRQTISDVATRLFFERGFDRVTVDEIAEAADVGRMTVFNHFPRKEDMFFDQDQEARDMLLEALVARDPKIAPLEAIRLLAHRLIAENRPYIRFFDESRLFVETVAASEALKSRARAIRDEVAQSLTAALALTAGRPEGDPDAHLAASLILATWTVALIQAHKSFRRDSDSEAAKGIFLALADKGFLGIAAAMADTPYCEPAEHQ